MKKTKFQPPESTNILFERFKGVDRMTVTIYAIMCLYEHGHISEGKHASSCAAPTSFRFAFA